MVRLRSPRAGNRPIGLLSVFTGRDPSGRFFDGCLTSLSSLAADQSADSRSASRATNSR